MRSSSRIPRSDAGSDRTREDPVMEIISFYNKTLVTTIIWRGRHGLIGAGGDKIDKMGGLERMSRVHHSPDRGTSQPR